MNHPSRQRGMTAISMAFILALVLFVVALVIKLFPIYLENFSVAAHLKSLAEDSATASMTDKQILSTLKKRFDLDDVTHVSDDDIFIERSKGGPMIIAVEYEVRTPAFGNVDMVVSFVDEVEVR